MSADSLSKPACPDCGSPVESISDCFTGQAKHIDNFDEIESELRDSGVVSDDEYELYADRVSRDEFEEYIAENRDGQRDGPFITESIVCTEAWCSNDDCDHSERTHHPLSDDI